jgi:dipeptidyl aminopeptidase/acylaminoacyl peptidase
MKRFLAAVLFACVVSLGVPAQSASALNPRALPLTLDELISDPDLRDAAVSPSGKYVALSLWRQNRDLVALMDLETRQTRVLTNIDHNVAGEKLNVRIENLFWKSDDRLLFRTSIWPDEHDYAQTFFEQTVLKMGERIFAINRDGTHLVRLMGDNAEGALDGAINFGRVASYLPNDPGHILLTIEGRAGLSLFKVDLNDGVGLMVEPPQKRTDGWWLDLDGHAVLRMESLNGTIRILRQVSGDDWVKVLSFRPAETEEHLDYEQLGPSDQPGHFYVLARPNGRDRRGIYLYDLAKESFGEPLFENPLYDLEAGRISRDGKRVVSYCYYAHVYICQFTDQRIESHMRGLRKFFGDAVNVNLVDASSDDRAFVLLATGPNQAPTYFYYRVDQARVEPLGLRREAMNGRPLPTGTVVKWKARDGVELSGYLLRPPGAEKAVKMPLVILPHGGPELRDHLDFDPWTQMLTARGYAVFQPNFRGSDGFGRAFLESGWGEWGGKMQDDITDGLDSLIAAGSVDPARVCIVGASYGGYAALAGAVKTPDKYRCAISVSGISDLDALVKWERGDWRRGLGWADDSEGYQHILRMIGDPGKDAVRLDVTSPAQHAAAAVKIPVLLIHGEEDDVTPISQSERMAKALAKAGQPVQFVRLPLVGHRGWRIKTERQVLSKMQEFLLENLGSGIPFNP